MSPYYRKHVEFAEYALVPGWNIPNWSPTFSLGVETLIHARRRTSKISPLTILRSKRRVKKNSMELQAQRLAAMDRCCYESERLGSTLRIFPWYFAVHRVT